MLRVTPGESYLAEYLVAWLNCVACRVLLDRYKAGGIMGHLTQEVVRNLPVPLPGLETRKLIAEEVWRRRDEARRLRGEAEVEWQAAKRSFEDQLLGAVQE